MTLIWMLLIKSAYTENCHFVQIMLEYFLIAITRNEGQEQPIFLILRYTCFRKEIHNTIVFDLPIQFRTSAESKQWNSETNSESPTDVNYSATETAMGMDAAVWRRLRESVSIWLGTKLLSYNSRSQK